MKTILMLLLSAILYTVAFSYPSVGVVGIGALALYVIVLRRARKPFLVGWIYGSCIVGGSLLWGFGAIPLTKIGVESPLASFFIVAMVWGLTSIVLGVATGVASAVYMRLLRQVLIIDTFLFASVWVLSEVLRSLLFSLLTLAPQSLIGPHWTFGYVGYMLADTSFLYLAGIGGVYVLSGTAAILAHVASYSWKYTVIILGIVLISLVPLRAADSAYPTVRVGVMKTYEPSYFSTTPGASQERYRRLEKAVRDALSAHHKLDILLLPEDRRFTTASTDEELASLTDHVTILDSSRFEHEGGAQSRITSYSPALGKQEHYTKMLLVPEGEYLSYVYEKFFFKIGLRSLIEHFYASKAYSRGHAPEPSHVGPYTIAASICSEIYSPYIIAALAKRSQFIVNPTSHAGMHDPQLLTRQKISMSKVRAVENNRYVLQATNYGDSFVITNTGVLFARTSPHNKTEVLVVDVPLITTRTIFSYLPYASVLGALLYVLLLGRFLKFTPRRHNV